MLTHTMHVYTYRLTRNIHVYTHMRAYTHKCTDHRHTHHLPNFPINDLITPVLSVSHHKVPLVPS